MDVKNAAAAAARAAAVEINFWKDPNGESCCICGEDDDSSHTELTCPYNYLAAAAAYVPCRARMAAWREDGSAPSEHRWYLRRFVRVTNLPPVGCRPADLAALLAGFGPLLMWHVVMDRPGACKGFACAVFQRREDADRAIDGLNCFAFCGRSLRVDWAYPSA